MTDNNPVPETKHSTLKRTLIKDRWRIAIVLALLAGVIYLTSMSLTIPRSVRLFAFTVFIGSVFAYPYVRWFVDWLHSPTYTYLVDFDSQTDGLAIWELPESVWRDFESTEYDLHSLTALKPAYKCKDYDPETNTGSGHWLGSASDLELVETRASVHEVKNELEDMAQEGLLIRVRQSSAVRTAVHNIVSHFIADYESSVSYGDEQLQDHIDDAIESWQLEKSRDTDSDEQETPPQEQTEEQSEYSELTQSFGLDNNQTNGN